MVDLLKQSLKDNDISAEQYYILELLNTDEQELYSYLQQHLKERNILIRNLYRRGFIDMENPDIENIGFSVNMELTGKGKGVVAKKDDLSWFKSWYDLWPTGVKTGDYYVRSGEVECKKKMIRFIKKNKFDSETIMKATQNYITRLAGKGYAYMQLASNFIEKEGKSTLAAECENLAANSSNESFIKDV